MKELLDHVSNEEKSCQVSPASIQCNDLNNLDLLSNNNKPSRDKINTILRQAVQEFNAYGSHLESELKNLQEKYVALEATIVELQKPCTECCKLKEELEYYKSKHEISNKTLFPDNDTPSFCTVIENNIEDEANLVNCIQSLSPVSPENPSEDILKTPPNKQPERATSPVVQNQMRSGKRKLLRVNPIKKHRMDDDFKVSPAHFLEIPETVINISPNQKVKRSTPEKSEQEDSFDESFAVGPSPMPISKNQRRVNAFGNKLSGVECQSVTPLNILSVNILENNQIPIIETKNNADIEKSRLSWDCSKKIRDTSGKKLKQTTLASCFRPKPVDISTSNEFKGGVASDRNSTKIDSIDMELTILTKFNDKENNPDLLNDLGNSQETFYNGSPQKTNDLNGSLQETFFKPDRLKKPENRIQQDGPFPESFFQLKSPDKVPIQPDTIAETYFEPMITSTQTTREECKTKKSPVEEQQTVMNSFDYVPSQHDSPKYKYRRDALRKKCDRDKLDGQDCIKCQNFYAPMKKDEIFGNLVKKVSRHRDKYSLHANTPPGLWDVQFKDSDGDSN